MSTSLNDRPLLSAHSARSARRSTALRTLALSALAGALLGSALTAVAADRVRAALALAPTPIAIEFPKRPLEREWRGYKTPVDPDSLFRKRR